MLSNIPLNWFDVKVLLLSGDKVWSHNAHLQPSGDRAREHTAKCIEATLVTGGYHLGDVHHQGSLGVTVLDTWVREKKKKTISETLNYSPHLAYYPSQISA